MEKILKSKNAGTSYQSLELQDMLTKKEGKKTPKDWVDGKNVFQNF